MDFFVAPGRQLARKFSDEAKGVTRHFDLAAVEKRYGG
jgi:hypothetical protein